MFEVAHSWAYDLDPDAVATYNRNLGKSDSRPAKVSDVRAVDPLELPSIDLFSFGFPCNDFSVVGQQLGLGGDYGPLYSYGIRVIRAHKPIAFVAENVSGLASANDGQALKLILSELNRLGYRVTPHLYNAEDYGVAQSRKRIIIVGIREDIGAVYLPPAISTPVAKTVRDALINNPVPANASNNELTKQSSQVVERLKHIRPGQNAFTADIPEHLQLNVQGAKISQIYKRLDPNKPAYTITGSGGGGTHVYHWEENRALTNRERARLQSFPDDFVFEGSKESVRKQIGMAVPPLLALAVFEALGKTLSGIEYASITPNIGFDSQKAGLTEGQAEMIFESRTPYARTI